MAKLRLQRDIQPAWGLIADRERQMAELREDAQDVGNPVVARQKVDSVAPILALHDLLTRLQA